MTATPPDPLLDDRRPASASLALLGFWLLVVVLILAGVRKIVMYDTMDPDAFWHMRVGHRLIAEGVHPIVDDISFASIRRPWTPYSWLAEIGMAKLWDFGGFRATILVECAMTIGIILFIAAASKIGAQSNRPGRMDAAPPPLLAAALATGAGGFLTLPYLSFRPATVAVLGLALVAWILYRDRARGERTLAFWLLAPICLLLTNLHLFAMLIPVWVGALAAGALYEVQTTQTPDDKIEAIRRFRRLAVLLGLCSAACLATPLLPGVVRQAFQYQQKDEMVASNIIAEIRPFYSGGALAKASLGIVILMGIAVIWDAIGEAVLKYARNIEVVQRIASRFGLSLFWKGKRLRAGEWLWLALSTVLLFKFGRFSPLFAPVAGPIFATTMPRFSARVLGKPAVSIVAGLVAVIGFAQVGRSFPPASMDLDTWLNRNAQQGGYPTKAAEYVVVFVKPPPGRELRVINEFNWGGYLAWRLQDRGAKIFIDGRTQLYPPELWRAVYLGKDDDTQRITDYLKQLDADVAILPKEKSRFSKSLMQLGWSSVSDKLDPQADVLIPPVRSAEQARTAK